MKSNYKSIFISDVHLGTRDCKASELHNFLKHNKCETLYLVGDIIDGWRIQQNKWMWNQTHSNVVQKILKLSKRKTKVIYVAGNHDEFLRPLMPYGIGFGDIEIVNQIEHIGVDGKRYLVIHGDIFDGISTLAPWLGFIGDKGYDLILNLNNKFNWIRHKMGFGYWSLSAYIKHKVKSAVDFIFEFEVNLISYCKKRGFDGIICGHVHNLDIKEIDGLVYMNSGDWVESMSAIVENYDGTWEAILWINGSKFIKKTL
jgi:UDP-2,3-diacylglucosamine pyrophosphatase LpxH